MNIFWFLTDSITPYKREDKFSILNTYNELKNKKEGFYFENALSLTTSTAFSMISIYKGLFPQKTLLDINLNNLNTIFPPKRDYLYYFKKEYKMHAFICFSFLHNALTKTYFNTNIKENAFKNERQLKSLELFNYFEKYIKNIDFDKNNLFYIHFMAGDTTMDSGLKTFLKKIKELGLWKDSIILIHSDHGYYDPKLNKNKIIFHFDDIHLSTLRIPLFLKLPNHLTIKKPRIIKERVYSIDILETIIDYLGMNKKIKYKRDAISFKPIIEEKKDINKNRIVRGDVYTAFQPIKKSYLIKGDYKLNLIDNKKELVKIKDLQEIPIKNQKIEEELLKENQKIEKDIEKNLTELLNLAYENSILKNIKNKTIIIPKKQFPPLLINFLYKKLKENKNIIKEKGEGDYLILIFNRMTGYGIKKLLKKHKKVKKVIILDLNLIERKREEISLSYWEYVFKTLIKQRGLLAQRLKGFLVFHLYFPLILNKHLKKYYK